MGKYKIIILDDHPLLIDGLRQLLAGSDTFEVSRAVTSFDDLFRALQSEALDILILDLNIHGKNSLNEIEKIRRIRPGIRILVFSSYNMPSTIRKALKKEVNGYILKDVGQEELLAALRAIAGGTTYIDPRVDQAVRSSVPLRDGEFTDRFAKVASLTAREKEVMQAIIEGLDNQAIAGRMFISLHTVQTHRKRLFKKLGVHSAAELIKLMLKQ